MYHIKKSCFGIAKKKMQELGINLKDLEEYGDKLLEEIYYDLGIRIKIEMYELDCKIYYVRYVDNKCVEFRRVK